MPPSPTLSDMEFENLDQPAVSVSSGNTIAPAATPSPPIAPPPDQPITKPLKVKLMKRPLAVAGTVGPAKPKTSTKLTRYLPPMKGEAFIGPLPGTSEETLAMIQRECRSLSALPTSALSLRLRFDGNTQHAVKDVLFRVLPQAWPLAITEVLPLVHVDVAPGVAIGEPVGMSDAATQTPPSLTRKQSKTEQYLAATPKKDDGISQGLTWDDLKKNGTLLGVQGWTDQTPGHDFGRGLLD
ncbi:hypothetical protein IAT38_008063 [Cryptococcus sp. DSM 104549]